MTQVRFLPTFLNAEPVTLEVAPGTTLLAVARSAGVPMGDACGGHCACSTCHVHVVEGFASLEELSDNEDDILGKAADVRAESRLGCQTKVGRAPLVIKVTRESQLAFINEHAEHRSRIGDVK